MTKTITGGITAADDSNITTIQGEKRLHLQNHNDNQDVSYMMNFLSPCFSYPLRFSKLPMYVQ